MKYFLIIIMTSFLIYGCNNVNKSDPNGDISLEDKLTSDTIPDKESSSKSFGKILAQPKLGCYYELDDKYSDSKDDKAIEKWWNNKLDQIKESGIQNDILSGKGGGPNGSEWNSSADLYFVAILPTERKLTPPINITLNGEIAHHRSIRSQVFDEFILVDFILDKEVWTHSLRPIEEKDYVHLFDKEQIEKGSNGNTDFTANLKIGEVFELAVDINLDDGNKVSITDIFHIAYGE